MNMKYVSSGDIVEVNKKGRIFRAMVRSKDGHEISVLPLTKGISYYTITARDIVAVIK